jgi:hypothetical protein
MGGLPVGAEDERKEGIHRVALAPGRGFQPEPARGSQGTEDASVRRVGRALLPGQRDALLVEFLVGGDQGVVHRAPDTRARRGGAIERFEDGA